MLVPKAGPENRLLGSMTLRDQLSGALSAMLPDAEQHPDFARFSRWAPLGQEGQLRVGGLPAPWPLVGFAGVYLVAQFSAASSDGPADPFDPAVIYVGRTRTRTLAHRLTNLRAGIQTGKGHSCGNKLHVELGGKIDGIYIAGLPVWVSRRPRPASATPAAETAEELAADQRQRCFRTAAIEALLIEAISRARRSADPGGRSLLNDDALRE